MELYSSVSIVCNESAMGWMTEEFWFRFLAGARKSLSFLKLRHWLWGPLTFLFGGEQGFFHQRRRLGHEVDHFLPSRAKVKDAPTPYSLIIWYLMSRGSNLRLPLWQANGTQWYVILASFLDTWQKVVKIVYKICKIHTFLLYEFLLTSLQENFLYRKFFLGGVG